jgi:hypothetical protein
LLPPEWVKASIWPRQGLCRTSVTHFMTSNPVTRSPFCVSIGALKRARTRIR